MIAQECKTHGNCFMAWWEDEGVLRSELLAQQVSDPSDRAREFFVGRVLTRLSCVLADRVPRKTVQLLAPHSRLFIFKTIAQLLPAGPYPPRNDLTRQSCFRWVRRDVLNCPKQVGLVSDNAIKTL